MINILIFVWIKVTTQITTRSSPSSTGEDGQRSSMPVDRHRTCSAICRLFHAQSQSSRLFIVAGSSPSFRWETRQTKLQKWSCQVWSWFEQCLRLLLVIYPTAHLRWIGIRTNARINHIPFHFRKIVSLFSDWRVDSAQSSADPVPFLIHLNSINSKMWNPPLPQEKFFSSRVKSKFKKLKLNILTIKLN